MTQSARPDDAGHRVYTPLFLELYDTLVLGFYSNRVWRCPVDRIAELYAAHIGRRHLDVGPGTGYFLARARPPEEFALTLLDPNAHVLAHAARRLAAVHPATVEADVREPLPTTGPFDSVALSFVLHCLPADGMPAAVRNVAAVVAPGGVVFGATVLGEQAAHTRIGRSALRHLNRRGVFDNLADTEGGLRLLLDRHFATVDVEVVGTAALFTARRPTSVGGSAGVTVAATAQRQRTSAIDG